jgi:hypothetical protein
MVAVNMGQEACQRRWLGGMYAEKVDAYARKFAHNAIERRHRKTLETGCGARPLAKCLKKLHILQAIDRGPNIPRGSSWALQEASQTDAYVRQGRGVIITLSGGNMQHFFLIFAVANYLC